MAEPPAQRIRRAITTAFIDYSEEVLDSVVDALVTGGVETSEDLHYIKEEDLLSVLRPVQARRFVAWAHNASQCESPPLSQSATHLPSSPVPSSSPSLSSASPSSSTSSLKSFEIPWQKLPEELQQCLARDKRPTPVLRRQMVRIIVSEMMKMCSSPTRQNTLEIARKMVVKYPKSLQDVIEGDVVGSGYDSLSKQLQARVENVKRPNTPKIKRRKSQESDECDTEEITATQRASIQDTYGCVNWEPKYLPVSETQESQNAKKEEMKKRYQDMNFDVEEIRRLVHDSYYSQRAAINRGAGIKTLGQEWPFLFEEIGMAVHFVELTGRTLIQTFLGNTEKKGKRLLQFIKHVAAPKCKRVQDTLIKCQNDKGPLDESTELIEMVLLLMSHFGETEENLFHYVEPTCLADEIELEKLPPTPCIIVCGSTCFGAQRFMLSIDQHIVNDHITSVLSALCLMFGSFYCFNVHYPIELRSTLEFLQRCFFSINPERSTKVEWRKNKKVLSVNPRVLTLIADLADHEWI